MEIERKRTRTVRVLRKVDFFENLPPEISVKILQLFSVETLGVLCCVSKRWRQLAEDDFIWKEFCELKGETFGYTEGAGWKTHYRLNCVIAPVFSLSKTKRVPGQNMLQFTPVKSCSISVLGNRNSGKSGLIDRYVRQRFVEQHAQERKCQRIVKVDKNYCIIYIVEGPPYFDNTEESFEFIKDFLKRGEAFIIVYSVDDRVSFEKAKKYVEWLLMGVDKAALSTVLAGTKRDRTAFRQVPIYEAAEFAKSKGIYFIETSAKTGENVDNLFHGISRIWVKLRNEEEALAAEAKAKAKANEFQCLLS